MDKNTTFYDRIVQAESYWNMVQDEYSNADEYYEDEQAPEGVPDDKEYVQDNIITDMIDRSVGQIGSGDITPVITGGGPMSAIVKELHQDILEANHFRELLLPQELHKFYLQGLGGLKFVDNPYRESRYGIGFPEIYGIRHGCLLLDPNSKSGMHEDDIYRINKERRPLKYGLDKWGYTDGEKNELYSQIEGSIAETDGYETEQFIDVYEIEYLEIEFYDDETGIRKEREVYYICKYVNKTVEVEKPVETGYPCFRIMPIIHTPRTRSEVGRYPMGLYKKLAQQQDQINVTSSVALETIKASIKQLVISTGQTLTPDEETKMKRELSKTVAFLNFKNPQARVEVHPGTSIPPALVQWYQWRKEAIDSIKGSSSQAQQFQSAASGQLSGKAINSLTFSGILPEHTKKMNIEYALANLSLCIFHFIRKKMRQPFDITRNIDGKEKVIGFNKMDAGVQPDDYNVVFDNGVVNDLSMVGEMDVKIKIEMNIQQRQEVEMNKAFVLWQAKGLALKDMLMKAYPDEWKEKLNNKTNEDMAMMLVQKMAELGPEFMNAMAGQIQTFQQKINQFQQNQEKL